MRWRERQTQLTNDQTPSATSDQILAEKVISSLPSNSKVANMLSSGVCSIASNTHSDNSYSTFLKSKMDQQIVVRCLQGKKLTLGTTNKSQQRRPKERKEQETDQAGWCGTQLKLPACAFRKKLATVTWPSFQTAMEQPNSIVDTKFSRTKTTASMVCQCPTQRPEDKHWNRTWHGNQATETQPTSNHTRLDHMSSQRHVTSGVHE